MGKLRVLVGCSRLRLEPGVSEFLARNLAILTLDGVHVWEPIRILQTRDKSTYLYPLPMCLSLEKWQQLWGFDLLYPEGGNGELGKIAFFKSSEQN